MTQKSNLIISFIAVFILLSLFAPFAQAATPISYGQTVSGAIDAAAEKDEFIFNASSGNVITIRFAKTSGNFSPYVELFSPQGVLIGSSIVGYLETHRRIYNRLFTRRNEVLAFS